MERQIIHWYRRGVASYVIASKFGISNTKVRSILKKNNVPIRSHNKTNKMSAMRRTPEENRLITQAASEANRGSTHSLQHRTRLALSRQKNPTIDPKYEKPLVDLCNKNGIPVIPQKAFNKFNVDLYFPSKRVALEIFGGGFHSKKEAVDMFNNKMRYLSRARVKVVVAWTDKNFNPDKVLKKSLSTTKQLLIIKSDGTETTRGLNDIRYD